jgi:hypothetical protein
MLPASHRVTRAIERLSGVASSGSERMLMSVQTLPSHKLGGRPRSAIIRNRVATAEMD